MKDLLLIFSLCLSVNLCGQEFDSIRILRVWENTADTIIEKVKKGKNGSVKKLYQTYFEQDSDSSIYQISEEFVRDKYWCLWREKEVVKAVKKNYTTLNYILDGKQYQFDSEGRTIFIANYKMGILIEPTIGINYYSNSKVKYIAACRDDKTWNILSYLYPNGETYNYGSFKDGEGTIVHLNDDGEPCLACKFIGNEITGRALCEDQDGR